MVENKLKLIDFSAGVAAQPLNYNYEIIHGWMKRERLRVGGYGLCEGFDMTYPGNFYVNISEGVLIDYVGDEVMVAEANFNCGEPEYETITENIIVDNEGAAELRYTPYSPSRLGIIVLNPPYDTEAIRDSELIVKNSVTGEKIAITKVIGSKVYLQAKYAGIMVKVTYKYCDDRIDAFMVDSDGTYAVEMGINSTSPSAADVNLGDRFLIGFAHWIVGRTIDVEFIMNERTYRRVYVDSMNRLYLNGKPYKEAKWIYFEEPKNPEEWDVWYDHKSNSLMVYCYTDGAWGWRVMNDFTNVPLRTIKMWSPEECPADLQTFLFDDDETDLRYVPNTEAIEIIIDQQVVMADQFTELVQPGAKPYLASGIGFKLVAPLDEPTTVQCVIHHVVKNAPLRNVFQRAAIFITENFYTYSTSNSTKIFKTDLPYAIGASQLEVFIDGKRANKDVDFVEMRDGINIATAGDKDRTSQYFKVTKALTAGQVVTYKISRYVWSYDQLNEMMSEIESKADEGLEKCESLQTQVNNLSENAESRLEALERTVGTLQRTIDALPDNYRKKVDKIALADCATDVKAKLVKSVGHYSFNATTNNSIPDCDTGDYVTIVCRNPDVSFFMEEGLHYSLSYGGGNAVINLEPEWVAPDNNLDVNIIRIGG